jgi:predicted unusual protein kinase regulating ubiquinone biosynthesis (AarF/ABC1/UbiB family)
MLLSGIKGAWRIAQTTSVLAKNGFDWIRGDRPPTPKLLRETFEDLGATYIKLGQFIASSPTLFPEEYVEEFQACLDQTEPLPYSYIESVLQKELRQPLDQVFAHIDPTALASASIAQVHAARLITGEDVVIKVQKPGVEHVIHTDLNFIHLAMKIMEMITPHLEMASLSEIVGEIQKSMLDECDFLKEAQNIEAFQRFLDHTQNHLVVVPKVYHQATSRRVLTMERLYGVSMTDLDAIKRYSDNPEMTLRIAMNTWFASLHQCDIFHADVHAGNLMVLQDGRVGFIDFGIVGRLTPGTWEALNDFGEALIAGNYETMANAMVVVGITKQKVDTHKLAYDLEKFIKRVDGLQSVSYLDITETENDINKLMTDFVKMAKRHGIQFPRQFGLLIKQLLYFDRYRHVMAIDLVAEDYMSFLN